MNNEKILVIDADSLCYFEGSKDTLEEAKESVRERIKIMCDVVDTDLFILCVTSGKTFRHNVDINYKANRKKQEPPAWSRELKQYLIDELNANTIQGLEADDIVGVLGYYFDNFIISSIDKDVLKQLPGTHWRYKYSLEGDELVIGEFITTSVEESNRFLYNQILAGDSTDNIKGIPGIGEKKANKILTEDNVWVNALSKYIDKFGVVEGTKQFNKTFNLVYIKRRLDELSLSQLKQFLNISIMAVNESEESFSLDYECGLEFNELNLLLNNIK